MHMLYMATSSHPRRQVSCRFWQSLYHKTTIMCMKDQNNCWSMLVRHVHGRGCQHVKLVYGQWHEEKSKLTPKIMDTIKTRMVTFVLSVSRTLLPVLLWGSFEGMVQPLEFAITRQIRTKIYARGLSLMFAKWMECRTAFCAIVICFFEVLGHYPATQLTNENEFALGENTLVRVSQVMARHKQTRASVWPALHHQTGWQWGPLTHISHDAKTWTISFSSILCSGMFNFHDSFPR